MPQHYPPVPMAGPKTDPVSIWAFALGLFGIVANCFGSVPAIICGAVSLSRIRGSGGTLAGRGFAIAGLVLGICVTVAWVLIIVLIAVFAEPSDAQGLLVR